MVASLDNPRSVGLLVDKQGLRVTTWGAGSARRLGGGWGGEDTRPPRVEGVVPSQAPGGGDPCHNPHPEDRRVSWAHSGRFFTGACACGSKDEPLVSSLPLAPWHQSPHRAGGGPGPLQGSAGLGTRQGV